MCEKKRYLRSKEKIEKLNNILMLLDMLIDHNFKLHEELEVLESVYESILLGYERYERGKKRKEAKK